LGKPARNLSLSIEALKTWGVREALAMAFFSTLSMGYLFYMFWLYARAGILALYGLLVVFYLSTMIFPSILLRNTHIFHFHHYAWAGMYMTLAGYQHSMISFGGAVHSGIMVEGIARWSFDKWWYRKNH